MKKSANHPKIPIASLGAEGKIPFAVSNMPSRLAVHTGNNNLKLVFEYYDHNRCEIKRLSKVNIKQMINVFSKITKYNSMNIGNICRPEPVDRSAPGDYGKLFNNLPEDFDYLLEIEIDRSSRVFIHPHNDMCLVVAVWNSHR